MITRELQQELFDKYNTPPHVIRHCNAVAEVAVVVGEALNEAGFDLDIDLISGAAMIHDFVRLEKQHDVVGAQILQELGYDKEAELVLHHMKYYPFSDAENITEQDIICLADRVVCEDEYVGVDKRMEYLLNKFNARPGSAERIEIIRNDLNRFIGQIESAVGKSLDEIIQSIQK